MIVNSLAVLTNKHEGIGLQDASGQDLPDLDSVLDCDDDIGVTVDGNPIRDPKGPEGLPLVGSYYEVFPDHLVNRYTIKEHSQHD